MAIVGEIVRGRGLVAVVAALVVLVAAGAGAGYIYFFSGARTSPQGFHSAAAGALHDFGVGRYGGVRPDAAALWLLI